MREAEGARIGVSALVTMAAMCPGIHGLLRVCTSRGVLGRALQGGRQACGGSEEVLKKGWVAYGGVEEVLKRGEKSHGPEDKIAMETKKKESIKEHVVKSEGKGPEWPYYTAGI